MTEIILALDGTNPFDQIKQIDAEGVEYWLARQLQALLGYNQWRRFEETIERAKLACQNSGYTCDYHFADAGNVVERQQGGGSRQSDYKLSRYACYLTAMNGDPRKAEIAAAQTYFALKTREAELALQNPAALSQILQKFAHLNQVIEEQGRAIAVLQSQIQNLLPISADFMPPGWDAKTWDSLPPQDKRHFRFMFRRRRFHPGNETEVRILPAITHQMRLQQRAEVESVVGVVSESELQKFEALKQKVLKQYRSFGVES
ncbi:MAG: BRO family protein [Nostoc sp.]|uniref:BRO family protein n=1 Tax=Nostoc sp. TaxID=1180 RepID=UPI002FF2C675